jgi:hypothetical protein
MNRTERRRQQRQTPAPSRNAAVQTITQTRLWDVTEAPHWHIDISSLGHDEPCGDDDDGEVAGTSRHLFTTEAGADAAFARLEDLLQPIRDMGIHLHAGRQDCDGWCCETLGWDAEDQIIWPEVVHIDGVHYHVCPDAAVA